MLEILFGSEIRVMVLQYLYSKKEGYAREISRFYDTDLSQIQKQLERLEEGGILLSKSIGKTKLYIYNSRFPFLTELQALIGKSLSTKPETIAEKPEIETPESAEPVGTFITYDPDFMD
jgi:hypothetical protein